MKKSNIVLTIICASLLIGCPKQLLKVNTVPVAIDTIAIAPVVNVTSGAIKVEGFKGNTLKAEIKDLSAGIVGNKVVGDNSIVEIKNTVVVTSATMVAFLTNVKLWQFIIILLIVSGLVYLSIIFEKEAKE